MSRIAWRDIPKKVRDQIAPQLQYQYPKTRFVVPSKYSNNSCRCLTKSHAIHDSIFEADVCNRLLAGGIPYCTQYVIELRIRGILICRHRVDFAEFKTWAAAKLRRNPIKFIEAKGYDTPEWKLKKKLTEAIFTKIPYEVLRRAK